MITAKLDQYIEESLASFDSIARDRKEILDELSGYIKDRLASNSDVKLTFICTHNSRRSHLSQIWAQAAAEYYRISGVHTFSGGTEATAFNPRAVAALERAGFQIERESDGDNPTYLVNLDEESRPIRAFSKLYTDDPNPKSDYCAVMTCSSADRDCPIVHGAGKRISLSYEDPKDSDGTDHETSAYNERCRQISIEMLYVFSKIPKAHL